MASCLRIQPETGTLPNFDCVVRFYSDWAETYDSEFQSLDYVAPDKACEALERHLPNKAAKIMDVGCGTGWVGKALKGRGYTNIDGLDISAAMLSRAEDRAVYNQLWLLDVLDHRIQPKEAYDAVVSVGLFIQGHASPLGIKNMLRMLKPGGIACITIHQDIFESNGYSEALRQLVGDGLCAIVEEKQEAFIMKPDIHLRIVTLRKS